VGNSEIVKVIKVVGLVFSVSILILIFIYTYIAKFMKSEYSFAIQHDVVKIAKAQQYFREKNGHYLGFESKAILLDSLDINPTPQAHFSVLTRGNTFFVVALIQKNSVVGSEGDYLWYFSRENGDVRKGVRGKKLYQSNSKWANDSAGIIYKPISPESLYTILEKTAP